MKYKIKKISDNAYDIASLERAISALRAENAGLNRALGYAQDRRIKDEPLIKDIKDWIEYNQSEIEKYERQIKELGGWRLKTMKQHRLEEESKQPPYDEVVITDLKHLGTLYIDLKRDGEVVWSGYSDSFIDGEDSRFRTVRRFTC